MGAKATFDSVTRRITLTQAPQLIGGEYVVEIDAKIDLYSDQKEDWLANPTTLRKVRPPFSIIGGQTTPTGFAGNTIFIRPDWKVIPYSADHILRVSGNLYSEDGKSPFVKPSSGFVQIERVVSNIVDTVAVGSAVTEQDKLDIANRVWIYSTRGLTNFGTLVADVWSYVTRILTSTAPPTKEEIRTEMDTNSTELAAIKAKTDNLPVDPAGVSDVPTAAENAIELLDNQTAP